MASKPPLDMDDQTDEDFFDKLVEEDDDDHIGGGCTKMSVSLADGEDSDEAKAFASLSLNALEKEFDDSDQRGEGCGDGSVGQLGIRENTPLGEESFLALSNSLSSADGTLSDRGLRTRSDLDTSNCEVLTSSRIERVNGGSYSDTNALDANGIGSSIQEVDQLDVGARRVQDVAANESPFTSCGSFACGNEVSSPGDAKESVVSAGLTSTKDGGPSDAGIKEVNWSSFSDAALHEGSGIGSYSDFFSELEARDTDNLHSVPDTISNDESRKNLSVQSYSCVGYEVQHGVSNDNTTTETASDGNQSLEYLYPGWNYDPVSGQWYPVDSYGANTGEQSISYTTTQSMQESFGPTTGNYWASTDGKLSTIYYEQQPQQSVSGTISQANAVDGATGWSQVSPGNSEYPAHMVFDPQYPGWYYDTITQQWYSLETFNSTQSSNAETLQQAQNAYAPPPDYSSVINQDLKQNWAVSYSKNHQQDGGASQLAVSGYGDNSGPGAHVGESPFYYNGHLNNHASQHDVYSTPAVSASPQMASQFQIVANRSSPLPFSMPGESPLQSLDLPAANDNSVPVNFPAVSGKSSYDFSQQLLGARSSSTRPPHALVTFGFGGKLIVFKDNSVASSFQGAEDVQGQMFFIHNLMEVFTMKHSAAGSNEGACSYFQALSQQSFPGPLVGCNVGSKELNRWIDERISSCKSSGIEHEKGEALEWLLSLIKIACQYYGKLRSDGADSVTKQESNGPEIAIAKLFASARGNEWQFGGYSAFRKCLTNWPSEAQMQATASEIQNLLANGRKMEALQCAQEGQCWAFALILAHDLGDQFYASTVKQMALGQLLAGSPLRTLCLLLAKSPGEVFDANPMAATVLPSPVVQGFAQPAEFVGSSVLDNWAENLAIITANRTESDHLVITHLGDCLLKERRNIIAAHICYLVAEAEFESYSDSARLCLIGADHWNFPRTYSSPEAIQMNHIARARVITVLRHFPFVIQVATSPSCGALHPAALISRTEVFEYSRVSRNSQSFVLPFQPYKILYAYMLAEVGKVSDSLKYCRAVSKSLKIGRAPESEAWKQLVSSLEERIKTHQQGGYAVNLASANIMGKLLNLIDTTAQRVVGPPPVTLTEPSSVYRSEEQKLGPAFASSQSTMYVPTMIPSASMEPVNQWAVNSEKMTVQNRSISEPVIAKPSTQNQVVSSTESTLSKAESKVSGELTPSKAEGKVSNESAPSEAKGKVSNAVSTSRFGRLSFGSQLLQKTVGLLKPRLGRQAKLGDENKFYYDEKLKRWVEAGAEPPAEEPALPPPPPSFSNTSDNNVKTALHDGVNDSNNIPGNSSSISESAPGIPSNPPSVNQFSARSRMGVRSRYVDTFNKGGGNPANLFQKPSLPSVKPNAVANTKFFVPAANSSPIQHSSATDTGNPEEESSANPLENLSQLPSAAMPRFPSVDNIPNNKTESENDSLTSFSRRTASWSGGHSNESTLPSNVSPGPSPLSAPPQTNSSREGELQDVEL